MHFVGVDLAWGQRGPTGVAVLDDRGRLLSAVSVGSDDEISAAVADVVDGPCVVAFDAPLVVTNATGTREAEKALNRDFRAYEAGTHPTNLSKPEFADGPRAGRLAARWGLPTDPATPGRRAIEVYPHAATVALLRLGRTLKYKQSRDRTFSRMRSEMLRLVEGLEQLGRARTPLLLARRPVWEELVDAVEHAGRKSELRAVEDRLDAVVCAYVALLAEREPDRMTVYGTVEAGCIVTPTLPEGLTPAPRPTRAERARSKAVEAYASRLPDTQRATEQALALVRAALDDAGINYLSVTARPKSVASFAAKAGSADPDGDGLRYTDPLAEMADQIGLRVVTYLESDVRAVAEVVREQLDVLGDRDKGAETARAGRWGYASRHLDVALPPDAEPGPLNDALPGRIIEVQVRTALQHAWAEFEHDIRYKGDVPPEHASELDRRFTLAAGLIELADREFSAVRDLLRGEQAAAQRAGGTPGPDDRDRLTAADLAAYLAGRYPGAGWSRTDHYEWVAGLLVELGITSASALSAAVAEVDSAAVTARMDYRYPAGAVRRLDDDLLAAYGETYLALAGNAHRVPLLTSRLAKLAGLEGAAARGED
ncbi:DUF429 domain-containing protein [Nocardioides zeae]|uniref:DUF429 domain-containing protein n=1 Tax=Nocardioides imazamoxiresistens TaxID=3231893 RepID=A0ABU3PXL0_9ACTN|nr:DUF429 domain-containing protein [Nocardioides zeae]MDT9593980.1 DUF429 domain-containing protein [Nocardioides zeae]